MNRVFTLGVLLVALATGFMAAQTPTPAGADAEKAAVRQAALDYVEGIYEVKPERIERSVHPNLVKSGFYKKEAGAPYVEVPMTYDQLVRLAGNWNKDKKRDISIKEVVVMDVLDQTASVKLVAAWGIDYMHLGKYDGAWKITQILWQSHPPKALTSR